MDICFGIEREDVIMLSVVVPIYNTEKYIDRCLASIVNQTYNNFEILLIDDGSTDASGWLCDLWAQKDNRIKVVHKDNGGRTSARTEGIVQAQGEYIAFIDSDDWIEPGYFQSLMSAFDDCSVDISISTYLIEYQDTDRLVLEFDRHKLIKMNQDVALREMFKFSFFNWSVCDKIYRSYLLKDMEAWWFTQDMGEDLEINWKVFNRAKNIVFIPIYGYHYCMRKDSITHEKRLLSHLVLIDRFDRIIFECQDNTLLQVILKKAFCMSVHLIISLIESGFPVKKLDCKYINLIDRWKDMLIDVKSLPDNLYYIIYERQFMNSLYDIEDCIEKLVANIKDFCGDDRDIYIYGNGVIGHWLENILLVHDIQMQGFLISVNSSPNDRVYNIYEVVEKYKGNETKLRIIVAMNEKNEGEVKEILSDLKFRNFISIRKYYEAIKKGEILKHES